MTTPGDNPIPASQIASDPASADYSEAALTGRFWERVRLFATRRLGSVAGADDVAQETMRRVVDALREGRVRQMEALPAFVFQTALHICLQQHRSKEREARALVRLAGAPDVTAPRDALASLISDERRAVIHRGLRGLRDEDRDLLRMLYFEDLEPEEIARRLGLTAGALRVRKHRALQKLGELVGGSDV